MDLTWDETDPDRVQITMRKFDKDEVDDMNLKDYLASDSGGEGEAGEMMWLMCCLRPSWLPYLGT